MAAKYGGGPAKPGLEDYREALDQAMRELPRLAVVHGECEFLRSEAIAMLKNAWLERYPSGDTLSVPGGGEGGGLPALVMELSGAGLFSKEKLVMLRQAERTLFPQSGKADDGDDGAGGGAPARQGEKGFFDYLDKPSAANWLVLETAQLPRNRIVGKKVAATCFAIPCPAPVAREMPGWLNARAARLGKRIDHRAADMLLQAHGADLGALSMEMEKLSLFAGEGENINCDMVAEFLTGTLEFDVFGYANAIESRDRRQALFYARRIAVQGARDQRGKKEDGEKSSHRILAMLATTVQNLLRAGVALAEGRNAADLAAEAKVSPWRAGKLLEAAARFDLRELRRMTGAVAEHLRRTHDTGGDALLALERMAVELTPRSGRG